MNKMHHFFRDYYWENGIPKGEGKIDPFSEENSYKIVTDPYGKRFSIEKYVRGEFKTVIYDSSVLDFRQLKILEQSSWHRSVSHKEGLTSMQPSSQYEICETSIIRNQDDRVILLEKQFFKNNWCRECHLYTPSNQLLSIHLTFYSHLGDPFNGVLLKDIREHLVMVKKYKVDNQFQFTELIEEQWNMKGLIGPLAPSKY